MKATTKTPDPVLSLPWPKRLTGARAEKAALVVPNRGALAAWVWSMARRLAAGEPQGNGWAMIVAVEEYAERLEEAGTVWHREREAKTWQPGTTSAPLAKAVKRADAAGARAVALAANA